MIKIPIDLTEEQKTVLAYLSLRQFWIVFPVAVISVGQLIFFNWPFISGWIEFFWSLLVILVMNGISCALAFIKMDKYDCYLSEFVTRRFHYLRSQKKYTN